MFSVIAGNNSSFPKSKPKKIGKTFKVLIDRKEGEFWIGRTEFDSPEVDNEVLISIEEKVKIGNFYQVKITDAAEFDLYGEIASK